MAITLDYNGTQIVVRVFEAGMRAAYVDGIIREFPTSYYDAVHKCWKLQPIRGMKRRIVKRLQSLHEAYKDAEAFRALPMDEPTNYLEGISHQYNYLYAFQAQAVDKALKHLEEDSGFGLFMTMGTGKTITALAIADQLHAIYRTNGTVIVCPNSLVKTWEAEIKKFMPDKSLITIGGERTPSREEREDIYSSLRDINYDFIVMPYSLATIDAGKYTLNRKTMIIDEASKIKNLDTGLTKDIKSLGKNAQFRLALSGSPVENWLVDYYSILEFVSPGIMSLPYFFQNYTVQKKSRFGSALEVVAYKNLDNFRSKVEPYGVRMTKEEVAPWLPPKVVQFVHLEQSAGQEDMAEQVTHKAKEMNKGIIEVFQLLRMIDDSTQLINLSDCKTVEDMRLISLDDDSVKLDWLQDFVEELGDDKVLIFTAWARMANIIQQKLTKWGKESVMITGDVKNKDQILAEFTARKGIQFLVATDCIAYGVNVDAADRLVNFDLPFNPATLNQRSDRIHRLTTKKTKYIYNLVGGGIEQDIYALLYEKAWLSERVVENKHADETGEGAMVKMRDVLRRKYGYA